MSVKLATAAAALGAAFALTLFAIGCGGPATADAGTSADAGSHPDAGLDAGAELDAGDGDGGAPDAAVADAGGDDAGTDAGNDAGSDRDGGGDAGVSCSTGGASCSAAGDCAAIDAGPCAAVTCLLHCCAVSPLQSGTPLTTQVAGDCRSAICDGDGGVTSKNLDTDAPDDQNPCTSDGCANGAPTHLSQPGACQLDGGTVCGDPSGSAAGQCVECNVTGDCTAPAVCTPSGHSCVAPTCSDGIKDGTETDKDCGGPCLACADNKQCLLNTDCQSGHCAGQVCAAPTCNDLIKNGTETDVDCGGIFPSCPPCADTLLCARNQDCVSSFCDLVAAPHRCKTPTCNDGQRNGAETGIDCGGATCRALNLTCPPGAQCQFAPDCTSGYCASNVCALKPNGLTCFGSAECQSGQCVDGVCCNSACSGVCQACSNSRKGGGGDGTCGAVLAGTDPDNECASTAASTCGTTGTCGGGGTCALWPAGTVCPTGTCNGSGTCQ